MVDNTETSTVNQNDDNLKAAMEQEAQQNFDITPQIIQAIDSSVELIAPTFIQPNEEEAAKHNSKFYKNKIAEQISTIKTSTGTSDPVTAFQESVVSDDIELEFQQAVDQKNGKRLTDLETIFRERIENNPVVLTNELQDFNSTRSQIMEEANSPIAKEEAVTDSLANKNVPFELWKANSREEAFRLKAMNSINKMLAEQGTLDTVTDYAGEFILPAAVALDVDSFMEELNKDPLFGSDAVNFQDTVNRFSALSPEEKAATWPALWETILRSTSTEFLGVKLSDNNLLRARAIADEFLNPNGKKQARNFVLKNQALGAFDIATMGIGGKAVSSSTKILNASQSSIKMAQKMGRTDTAAALNTDILRDSSGLVGEAMSTSRTTAYGNANAYKQSTFDYKHTDNLAEDTTNLLNEQGYSERNKVPLDVENRLITEGILRKSTEDYKLQNIEETFQNLRTDYYNEGIIMSDVTLVNRTGSNATFQYTLKGEGGTRPMTQTINYTLDDVGSYIDTVRELNKTPLTGIKSWLGSPTYWSKGSFSEAAEQAINLDYLSSRFRTQMGELVDNTLTKENGKKLNSKEQERVSAVLIAGDEYINPTSSIRGTEFTKAELKAGITTPDNGIIKLTDDEIAGYYKARSAFNDIYQMMNTGIRKQLDLQGLKSTTVGTIEELAKPLTNLNTAKTMLGRTKATRMLDADGNVVNITDELLEKAYSGNEQLLVRFKSPVHASANDAGSSFREFVQYALVNKTNIKELPVQVLQKKPGYVTKINKDVRYLAMEGIEGMMDGNKILQQQAHRFFASKTEAQLYVDQQNQKLLAQGKEPRFSVKKDKELSPELFVDEQINSVGGLYTGARSSHDIRYGINGMKPERANAYEALIRNSQHLARFMARNEWRLGREQEWLNTVRKAQQDKLIPAEVVIRDFRTTRLGTSTNAEKILERMREQINTWNQIPMKEEHFFEGLAQAAHDFALDKLQVLGFKGNKLSSILRLTHADLPSAMRSANFHVLLGMFNPSQLVVQGMAATIAAARFPLSAPINLPKTIAYSFLDNIKNPGALKKAQKALGIDAVEYDAWIKSGYKDDIKLTADYKVVEDGLPGMSQQAIKRLGDKALFFYRAGELFNRRFSFLQSYNNLVPKGTKVTDDIIKQVIADAEKSRLQLSKANAAKWQGGINASTTENILSVTTQFQQVFTKTAELMFLRGGRNRGYTVAEKARIMFSQGILFGAAGVPLGEFAFNQLAGWLNLDTSTYTREQVKAINGGFIDWMVYSYLGADIEVSSRVSIFNGMKETFSDIFADKNPLMVKLLGPFAGTGSRVLGAIDKLYPMLFAGLEEEEFTYEDMVIGITELGRISSTGNNAYKAYMMANVGTVIDRHGNKLTEDQKKELPTVVGQALGFQSSKVQEVYELRGALAVRKAAINEKVSQAMQIYHNYIISIDSDPNAAKKMRSQLQFIANTLPTQHDRDDFWDQVNAKINQRKSTEARTVHDFINNTLPDQTTTDLFNNYGPINLRQNKAVVQPISKKENE